MVMAWIYTCTMPKWNIRKTAINYVLYHASLGHQVKLAVVILLLKGGSTWICMQRYDKTRYSSPMMIYQGLSCHQSFCCMLHWYSVHIAEWLTTHILLVLDNNNNNNMNALPYTASYICYALKSHIRCQLIDHKHVWFYTSLVYSGVQITAWVVI